MRVIIHDLSPEEWSRMGLERTGDRVISPDPAARPCVGCYSCWVKTPGKCVIPDGYETMGQWVGEAEEMILISRARYGNYSSFVKNMMDRSISCLMPFFEIRHGEMHHQLRYGKGLKLQVWWYGEDLTETERATAENLARANAKNMNAELTSLRFLKRAEDWKEELS